jgi:SAM-dependent methyltransferase
VAEVYELDKPVGSSFPGLRYYTRQLAGVTGRILEPATGTGRGLVPLLEAGFAVEGLDVSPDMLAVCRQHCQDRGLDLVLREADMTTFAEPGAYQAIIIPAGPSCSWTATTRCRRPWPPPSSRCPPADG